MVLHSHDGYTTNLALEDFAAEDALLAHSWSGKPLEQEHGGPVRLVVPHLYFWKSAKWLQSIEFLTEDAPGYWEVRGYHNRGDPWKEAALFWRLRRLSQNQEARRQPVPTERFQFTGEGGHQLAAALDTARRRSAPTRCSRIASPAARTCWRRSGSRSRSRPRASRCCGSTSPASAPARAISPIRPSPPTSPISSAPPIICARPGRRRRS